MKVPIKKILFYSGMVLLGLVVVFLVCRVLLNLDALGNTVRGIFGSLRAIVLGCVMAYLLYPLTRFSEQFLLYHKVRKKTARSLSTAFSTFVLLALIVLFAYFIIPQLVFNVPPLIQNLPNMVSDFSQRISDYLTAHGQPTTIITTVSEKITAAFNAWLQDDPLSALVDLAGRVAAAAKSVLNFIIGIIVMVYLLMSRDQFVGQGKKILFALCRKRSTCDVILKHLRAINRIFSGFVSGKLLDSLIIGIICGICLSLLHMPYAMLISVIVGITNIIPVFGPFFGAIPSAFILLLTDPGKCLIFIVFVIILQQVDGNIIGPKILGDSTGLSAFWVLFALLLFNHLMGFWGMLLGVPLFATICSGSSSMPGSAKSPFLWRPRNTSMCPGLTRRAPSPICRPLSLSFILCSGGRTVCGPGFGGACATPSPRPRIPPQTIPRLMMIRHPNLFPWR